MIAQNTLYGRVTIVKTHHFRLQCTFLIYIYIYIQLLHIGIVASSVNCTDTLNPGWKVLDVMEWYTKPVPTTPLGYFYIHNYCFGLMLTHWKGCKSTIWCVKVSFTCSPIDLKCTVHIRFHTEHLLKVCIQTSRNISSVRNNPSYYIDIRMDEINTF